MLCERCLEDLTLFNEEDSLMTLPSGVLAASSGPYITIMTRLIRALKFSQNMAAARALAAIIMETNCPRYLLTSADIVLPVPISHRRRFMRGFNQCELILAEAAKMRPIAVNYKAIARRHRRAQSRLSREERLKNAQGAFMLLAPEALRGRVVTIFDDVMTTMATAEAMVAAILPAEPKEVRVVTAARTI